MRLHEAVRQHGNLLRFVFAARTAHSGGIRSDCRRRPPFIERIFQPLYMNPAAPSSRRAKEMDDSSRSVRLQSAPGQQAGGGGVGL